MEWISIKNELPPYGIRVRIATKRDECRRFGRWIDNDTNIQIGKRTYSDNYEHFEFDNGKKSSTSTVQDYYVTHWKPLDEAPKE